MYIYISTYLIQIKPRHKLQYIYCNLCLGNPDQSCSQKKYLFSLLETSKQKLEDVLDSCSTPILGIKQLRSIIKNSESLNEVFDITTSVDHVISFLLEGSQLTKVKFLTPREETLYLWRNPNEYKLMPALRPNGYYSHLSAMYFHELLNYHPKSLYFNNEQKSRPIVAGSLEQGRIDNAFKKKQRITTSRTKYDGKEYWLLNGKQTGNYGVISLKTANSIEIKVTDLERTLIDIAVRPAYAGGGPKSVLKTYRLAQSKVSVPKLKSTLQSLNYIYPYHQSIGFYMQTAGNYTSADLDEFMNFRPLEYDFYLDYEMKDTLYSNQWKIYYPKDLTA